MYLLESPEKKGNTRDNRNRMEFLEDSTENRLTLYALEGALKRMIRPSTLYLHIPCNYVAAALQNGWAKEWEKNDWKTRKGEPVKDVEKWQSILDLLNVHTFEVVWGKQHIYSDWMKRTMKGEKNAERT